MPYWLATDVISSMYWAHAEKGPLAVRVAATSSSTVTLGGVQPPLLIPQLIQVSCPLGLSESELQ